MVFEQSIGGKRVEVMAASIRLEAIGHTKQGEKFSFLQLGIKVSFLLVGKCKVCDSC